MGAQLMAKPKHKAQSHPNGKPFRTRTQKAEARATAVKCEDGTWRSPAPVSYHSSKERREG